MSRLNGPEKFLVGDKVRVLNLHEFDRTETPIITQEMYRYIGRVCTVNCTFSNGRVTLKEIGSFWNPKWLERII